MDMDILGHCINPEVKDDPTNVCLLDNAEESDLMVHGSHFQPDAVKIHLLAQCDRERVLKFNHNRYYPLTWMIEEFGHTKTSDEIKVFTDIREKLMAQFEKDASAWNQK